MLFKTIGLNVSIWVLKPCGSLSSQVCGKYYGKGVDTSFENHEEAVSVAEEGQISNPQLKMLYQRFILSVSLSFSVWSVGWGLNVGIEALWQGGCSTLKSWWVFFCYTKPILPCFHSRPLSRSVTTFAPLFPFRHLQLEPLFHSLRPFVVSHSSLHFPIVSILPHPLLISFLSLHSYSGFVTLLLFHFASRWLQFSSSIALQIQLLAYVPLQSVPWTSSESSYLVEVSVCDTLVL